MIKHLFLILGLLAALTFAEPVLACTSAVVSGKVTLDGRSLLWKNRDTDYLRNHVAYVKGEKYDFIADVNSDNFPDLKEAWVGTNSAGFALMNTQSYNLVEVKDGEERGAANGRIIYRALEVCATVEDFCHFLDTITKPSLIEANFGVIDAKGGAAMFEVDYYKYTMYDANDPKDAPYGYIARTNFSFAGEVNRGAGYVRYMEADRVLMKASATGGVTPQGIFNDLSRSFRNCMLDIDLRSGNITVLICLCDKQCPVVSTGIQVFSNLISTGIIVNSYILEGVFPFRICIDQYHLFVQFSGQLSVSFLIISQNDQTLNIPPGSHVYYIFNFFPTDKHDEITFPFCFCLYGSDQLSHKGILQRLHSMGSGKSKHYSDDSGAMT